MRRRNRHAMIAASLAAVLACPVADVARADSAADASVIPFGPQSFWRTPLATAPIASDSKPMVDRLVSTITDRYGGIAAFNAHQYNSPLHTVGAGAATVDFAYDDCQGKGHTPSGLLGPGGQFTGVPVPADAVPATGSDAELSVYSSATDQLWEFWKARRRADGTWSACWGGRLDHVSTSPGYFSGTFGATASGLPNAGGLVRLSEIRTGRISHAMSLAIPSPAIWSVFRWPAQRSDGSDTNPASLPEGSRLRLDPDLDLTRAGLSPAGLTIARAAQQYGFIVADKSGAVSVLAEAVPAVGTAPDPWRQLLGTPDYAVLKNFPWSRLQVVADGWRGPTAAAAGTATSAAAHADPTPLTTTAPAGASAVLAAPAPAPAPVVPSTGSVTHPAAPLPPVASNAAAPTGTAAPSPSAQPTRDAKATRAEKRARAAKKAAARRAAAAKQSARKAAKKKAAAGHAHRSAAAKPHR